MYDSIRKLAKGGNRMPKVLSEYQNEITSLSAIAGGFKGGPTQGSAYFTYNGKKVSDIAEETQWKND